MWISVVIFCVYVYAFRDVQKCTLHPHYDTFVLKETPSFRLIIKSCSYVVFLNPQTQELISVLLDQSHIMGGDLEPSLDSLCLCPAQLIREVLCSSWAITPPLLCRALTKQTEMMWITCLSMARNKSYSTARGSATQYTSELGIRWGEDYLD